MVHLSVGSPSIQVEYASRYINFTHWIYAVTEFHGYVFVRYEKSISIIQPPNTLVKVLKSKDTKDGGNMVACYKNNCVYALENSSGILKISQVEKDFQVSPWLSTIGHLIAFSISMDGFVVLLKGQKPCSSLEVFDAKPKLLWKVVLPPFITQPQHAVATARQSFIVSFDDYVCEVNFSGHVVNSYIPPNDNLKLQNPSSLAFHPTGKLFVTDELNDRVLQLDCDLNLQKVIVTREGGLENPCQLSFHGANQLMVLHGYSPLNLKTKGNKVDIFELNN